MTDRVPVNGVKGPITEVVILANDQGGTTGAMQVFSLRTGRNVGKVWYSLERAIVRRKY